MVKSRTSTPEDKSSRIVTARVRLLRAEAADGIAMSFAPLRQRTTILVELVTADGLIGYGESWANFPSWVEHERLATLREGVLPLIIGASWKDIQTLHQRLVDRLEPIGRQWGAPGPIMQAISAVDIALWDLAGKAQGRSVADILGRVRSVIPVYASSLGPRDVLSQAERCRRAGYRAVKVKIGFGRGRDKAILESARTGCGNGIELYADANQAWSLKEAIDMAEVLREFGIRWVEEPLRGNRLHELETFHRQTGIDIATGENLYGRDEFVAYCHSPAIRVIQPDVTKSGGLTEVIEICRTASGEGKEIMPHLYGGAIGFAATLQLAGAAPGLTALEYDIRDNPLRDPVWRGGPIQVNGSIEIPSRNGLGIDPDGDVVQRHIEDL